MYVSKFKYIEFDDQAREEQNKLRERFKHIEADIQRGDYNSIMQLEVPENEYIKLIWEAKNSALVSIDGGYIDEAMRHVEVLYCLLGKEIRSKLASRLFPATV